MGRSTDGVHPKAATGFARGAVDYARGRPSYPRATVDWLVERFGEQAPVLDVGAGTGAMAGLLVDRGLRVLAVEAVAAMAARMPPDTVRVLGRAADLPVGSASVSGVVAATAFHWFASGAVLAEMARVLRPGGVVALVWNVRDERVPWVRAHSELVQPYAGDTPRFASRQWRQVVASFPELVLAEEHDAPNPWPMDRPSLVHRILSTSYVAALPAGARAAVEGAAWTLAASLPERFDYPYVTRSFLLRQR